MLRFLLGTIFLLSSPVPAFAASAWICGYCRGGIGYNPGLQHYGYLAPPHDQALAVLPAAVIIYPGVVALLLMVARHFLKLASPHTPQDDPRFMRGAIALSVLWLAGFFPFLSSAEGGFLFCVTAVSCIGAWLLLGRYGTGAKAWERALVFWSFFFFSLLAAVLAMGYGDRIGPFFDFVVYTGFTFGRRAAWLVLALFNAGALLFILRLTGARLPRPTTPEAVLRAKIYGVILAAVFIDVAASQSSRTAAEWTGLAGLSVLALPALAYYGIYRMLLRLPAPVRERAGPPVFVALALFLALMTGLAAGNTPLQTLALATLLCFALALAVALDALWRSGLPLAAKALPSAACAAAVLLCASAYFRLDMLSPPLQDAFIRERLLPALSGWRQMAALLGATAAGIFFILSPAVPRRGARALGVAMIFALLLGYECLLLAAPAAAGVLEGWR